MNSIILNETCSGSEEGYEKIRNKLKNTRENCGVRAIKDSQK